jgi:hypothetical protein
MFRLKNILLEQDLPKKSIEWHQRVVTRLLNNESVAPIMGTLENIKKYYPQADPEWKPNLEYTQIYDWLNNNPDLDTKLMNNAFEWILQTTDGIGLVNKTEVIKVPDLPGGINSGYIHLHFNITLNEFSIERIKADQFKASCTVNMRADDVTPGGTFKGLYFDEDIEAEIEIERALLPIDKTGNVVEPIRKGINWLKSKFTGKDTKDLYSKTHMMAVYYTSINLNMHAEQFKGTLPKPTVLALAAVIGVTTALGGLLGGLAVGAMATALRNIQLRITDNKIELGIVPRLFNWIDPANLTDILKQKLKKVESDIKHKTMHKVPIGNIYDTLPDSEIQRLRKVSIIATAAKHGYKR